MAIRGISSYTSNLYRNKSTGSDQLAALLRRSSVNKQMLKMAYSNLEKINSKKYLNRTDINDIVDEIENGDAKTEAQSIAENNEALKKNTVSMRQSSIALLNNKQSDDEFVKSVKAFAENYNSTVNTLKKSENYVAVSSGINMVNTTACYAASLKGIGVTVNDDNTLSVDESTLKNNIGKARNMFEGNYSYGGKMAKKASDLQTISQFSLNGTGIYDRFGSFLSK